MVGTLCCFLHAFCFGLCSLRLPKFEICLFLWVVGSLGSLSLGVWIWTDCIPCPNPALVLFVALAPPFPIPFHGALSLAPSPKFACYCLCTIFRKGLAWKFSGLKFLMVWHVLSCSWMLVVSRCWGFWVCFVWSFFWYWGSDMILLQPLPTHDDYDNEALG